MKSVIPSVGETYRALTGNSLAVGIRKSGEIYVPCVNPDAHTRGDRHPSLRINETKDVWRCDPCDVGGKSLDLVIHAGRADDRRSALSYLGVESSEKPKQNNERARRVVAEYLYTDEDNKTLYAVERHEPRNFLQKCPSAEGGWRYHLNGVRRVPYKLPRLRQAIQRGETIFIVEGEKDVETLAHRELVATTNAGGCPFKWPDEWAGFFAGAKRIVVIPDCDEVGRKAARARAAVVARVCEDVRFLDLAPERLDGFDITDYLATNPTDAEFQTKLEESIPFLQESAPSLSLVRMSDVQPENIQWIWRNRIACGKVSLLVGDPGAGKSYISLAISAAITHGVSLPDDDNIAPPGSAIVWSGEDGIADTIRVRAEAVGANLTRLYVIEGALDENGKRAPFSLNSIDALAQEIRRISDVRLVVIDPLIALLGGVDAYRDAEVRAGLQGLVDLASQTRVAILCIMHLRKAEAQRALYRVGGSIGFVGLARTVLLAAKDPETGQRAIASVKNNLGAEAPPIEYRLDDEGRFWWGKIAEGLSAEYLLRSVNRDGASSIEEAMSFLREALASGARNASEIEKESRDAGISIASLKRARRKAGVRAIRVGGIGAAGSWMLSLPAKEAKGLKDEVEPLSLLTNEF